MSAKIAAKNGIWTCNVCRLAFKDCSDLNSRAHIWVVRAWVQIPFFAAIFADIHRQDKSLWLSVFSFHL